MDDATRTIDRAYRLRAYPTHTQCALLGRLFGATRYIWNWALSTRTVAYRECGESINWIALSRQFTALKQRPETAWLCELPREPFNQVLRDQERAFQNFFAKRAAYPKYRRRGQQSAVRFTLDQRRSQVTQSSGRWALREKRWTCACGAVHDRDVNAARNILREGLRVLEGAAPPRSGAYARGEADAAGDGTSSSVTARSTNRELISGQRKRSNPGSTRMERVKAGTG